jgi:hypothetical protein
VESDLAWVGMGFELCYTSFEVEASNHLHTLRMGSVSVNLPKSSTSAHFRSLYMLFYMAHRA